MSSASSDALVLAGDVGGTKTLLALCDRTGRSVVKERFPSADWTDLEAMARTFLANHPGLAPRAACFGVAGPVDGERSRITNLPWVIEAQTVAAALGVPRARLINDFVAVAESIPLLGAADLVTLQEGIPSGDGNLGVLGAGTGLGEALLLRAAGAPGGYQVVASEGGHRDFAPRNDEEVGLWRFLARSFPHVSYERVLSGHGLVACFEYLCEARARPCPEAIRQRMATEEPAAVISAVGLAGEDVVASQALELFASVYGAEAGNLALGILATGGIYLAGGIAAKMLTVIKGGALVRAFGDKGRFRPFCERVPLHLIVNPEAGLVGAAACALRLTET